MYNSNGTSIENTPTAGEQAVNRRANGQFAKGNEIGSRFHFTTGVSGNTNGRPKNNKITDQLHKLLDEGLNEIDVAETLARIAISKALAGDYRFFSMILDRTEGKVSNVADTSSMSTITVRYATLSISKRRSVIAIEAIAILGLR